MLRIGIGLLILAGLIIALAAHADEIPRTPTVASKAPENKEATPSGVDRPISILPHPVKSSRQGESAPESPPLPRPSQGAIISHLQLAADHLRQAGFDQQASDLLQVASSLQHEQLAELQEKRKLLQQLQCEIAELEHETGVAAQYQLTCLIAELSLAKVQKLGITLSRAPGQDVPLPFASLTKGAPGTKTAIHYDSANFEFLTAALQKEGCLKVLSRPTLVVPAGRPASIRTGGEFPVIVPTSGEKSDVDWQEYGVRVEAVVTPLGGNRVRLDVAPAISEREMVKTASNASVTVPALRTRSVNTQAELNLNETLILGFDHGDEDQGTVTIFAVSLNAISPTSPTGPVRLEPVPESADGAIGAGTTADAGPLPGRVE